ncbi:hypothetical protein [Ferrimicrobium sp.]|uniref:hypothetical protein n=1 Tax=Ferrimicrobium sp. TaxID=2926050 RepID=UPI0026064170|nr:hypothetical protein [Ferrimicrobium sp.]
MASIASFFFLGQGTFPAPASQFASASVGISLTNGSLQATNLLPGAPTNTIPLTLANTGDLPENFDLQFTGVTDTLKVFGDLGQLQFLVTTPKGTITYRLDPGLSNSLGLSSPLTLSSLEIITLPIADGVAPKQQVSIPLAVELASGEGFGNAWNGKSATISYRIVASESAPTSSHRPNTTPLLVTPPAPLSKTGRIPGSYTSPTNHRVVAPVSASQSPAPTPVRLVTGPPQASLDNGWDIELGGGLMGLGLAGLGIAGISVMEVSQRYKKRRAAP